MLLTPLKPTWNPFETPFKPPWIIIGYLWVLSYTLTTIGTLSAFTLSHLASVAISYNFKTFLGWRTVTVTVTVTVTWASHRGAFAPKNWKSGLSATNAISRRIQGINLSSTCLKEHTRVYENISKELEAHWSSDHVDSVNYSCSKCNFTSKKEFDLGLHISTNHPEDSTYSKSIKV